MRRSVLNQSIQMDLGFKASPDEICQIALARLVLALGQSAPE
jgi:hypothetical protein